ncbi:trypsin-like peptidase domain-containing protein [Streptomyces sp. SudanB182_2057]|uniref:trypsin-like peptidase domain-containing protein n=1 Tax=Streptomyces sp. SudanB182_2057 TaxID=3035281 RepID=UPI003F564AF4
MASGFLLAPGLVITAAHAVRGPGPYEVRSAGERALVREVVAATDRDIALLTLETPAPDPGAASKKAAPGPEPVRFAVLPEGAGQVAVHAVGFPRFALEDGLPRSHQLNGTVQLGSDRSDHQIQLSLTSSDPPPGPPGRSPWEGCSGAGLRTVYEGLLVGVVTSHRPDGDRRGLTGTTLTGLTDDRFLSALAGHGVEAEPLPVRLVVEPSSARVPAESGTGDTHWLPKAVREVLARQREQAAELPYRFREDRRARRLTDVYVRQVLSPGPPPDAARTPEGPESFDGSAPVGAAGLLRHHEYAPPPSGPSRPLREILTESFRSGTAGHLLIEAPPGAGKTTLLHMCGLEFGDAALAASPAPETLVPLWVPAAQLGMASHSLVSAVAEAVGLDTLPPLPGGARWLVLIDALDEVPHDHRSRLIHRLADRAGQNGTDDGPYLLLTTRPDPDAASQLTESGFHRYVLDLFDRRRLEEFAHGWFADSGHPERTEDFLAQVDATGLGELLGVPLLATVAAVVHGSRPDAPLPDNSWDLYEQFRLHLRAVKHEQARRLWADLEERAAPTPDGTRVIVHLREHAGELLREVAYAQVTEGERDLVGVAGRWWAKFAGPPLDGWSAVLTETLLTTGLFIRRGRGLEFLHTTFAEHLAAEWLATRLAPSFDPADPLWRTTLLAASGITGHPLTALYRKALVHHARRNSGGSLLERLQNGAFDGHVLAAELMADRYPADEVHYRRFLEALRERGGDADHLLARLRHPLVTEYLREQLVTGSPPERLSAARVLAPADGEAVARELPDIAASYGVDPWEVHAIGQFLKDDWPEQTTAALAVIWRGPGPLPWDRIRTAEQLGAGHEETQAEMLRAALRGQKGGPYALGQIAAARTLAELGEAYEREAIEWLAWTALNPLSLSLVSYAMVAVDTLSTIGGGRHRKTAVRVMRRYITRSTGNDRSTSYLRGRAASRLLRFGEPYASEAVPLMRAHTTRHEYLRWAARELNGHEPREPAGGTVEDALDRAVRAGEAWSRGEPAAVDTSLEEAVRQMLAADGAAAVPVLVDGVCALDSVGNYGRFRPDVMAALGAMYETFPAETARELRALYGYEGPADDLYDTSLRNRGLREAVLDALLTLGVLQPPGDSPLLLRLAGQNWKTEHRTAANDALCRATPAHKAELAATLRRTLTRLDRSYVRTVADTLRQLGDGHVRQVGNALRVSVGSPDPAVRLGALQGLLALGAEWVPTDAALLEELAVCRRASATERLRAIRALAFLEGRLSRRTIRALYDVVEPAGEVGALYSIRPLVSSGPFVAPGLLSGGLRARARRILGRHAVRMHPSFPSYLPRISREVPAAELGRAVRARLRVLGPGRHRRRLELAKILIALGDNRSITVAARALRRMLVSERHWSFQRREIAESLVLLGDAHARRLPARLGRWPMFWRTPVRDWGEDTLSAIASGGGRWETWAVDALCATVVSDPGAYDVERSLSVLVDLHRSSRPQVLRALRAVASSGSPVAPRAFEALELLGAERVDSS